MGRYSRHSFREESMFRMISKAFSRAFSAGAAEAA